MQRNQSAVIRTMAVKSPCDFMWLIGAGASATSGIWTARQCIWAWKRDLFLTSHPTLDPSFFANLDDRRTQDRIQAWIASIPGSPVEGDATEYSHFIEQCYPRAEDRRRNLESIVREGSPGPGYRLLARIVDHGHFRRFWTTNFDDMLERALATETKRPIRSLGMDTAGRLRPTTERDDNVDVVHLHGDYRYDPLKNTETELRTLDAEFTNELSALAPTLPLIVAGYSGADDSVMSALESAYSREGSGALYWLSLASTTPGPRVTDLVKLAADRGYDAAVVETNGFDDFIRASAQLLLPKDEVGALVDEERNAAATAEFACRFSHASYPGHKGLAKSNSFTLTLPTGYLACPSPSISSWKDLRSRAKGLPAAVGLLRGRVVGLGSKSDIAKIAGAQEDQVSEVAFVPADLESDSVLHSVLRDYVIGSLAGDEWSIARRQGQHVLFKPAEAKSLAKHSGFRWCPAAELNVHFHNGEAILTLIPDRHVIAEKSDVRVPREAWYEVNRELSRQWNQPFNKEFNDWRQALHLDGGPLSLAMGVRESAPIVTVHKGPRLVSMLSPDATAASPNSPGSALVGLEGFQLEEPSLRFAKGADTHPLRGLLELGPIEDQLPRLSDKALRLGIVAPTNVDRGVEAVLEELVDGHSAVETKRDYQSAYPGFAAAFRCPIRVGTAAGGRIDFPTRLSASSEFERQREALETVCAGIDRAASASASVVLVVFPRAWEDLSEVRVGDVRHDFHDYVKAYAAPRGIRTQMLREDTPRKRQRLEVLWWLALAIFAKSNRVPWMLESATADTVHVGIGYGLDVANKSRPVVMCCSHIYQSSGLGVQFQLSEIGQPASIRRRNPYLTSDDAYRVAGKALQAALGASNGFPKRVSISKRTPFSADERRGFLSALSPVDEVELLTIEREDGLRLVRGSRSGSDPDSFPVPRGTVVPYGEQEALVWVHGDVAGISSQGNHYYQGKSRIPAPLRIRRFAGSASLEEVAADVLRLSKMDWNSADLYGQLPAQLSSPGRIARVAKLMDDIQLEDRDYRLFM